MGVAVSWREQQSEVDLIGAGVSVECRSGWDVGCAVGDAVRVTLPPSSVLRLTIGLS